MCGIAGIVDPGGPSIAHVAERMGATLRHRGPDDDGVWFDPAHGVALAHTRLSIVDLSAHGHQPMRSPSGRTTIVFNGEIYNHRALRAELDVALRGDSDTEVLAAAIDRWGFRGALERANGMFAVAAWDASTATLSLARDRIGEKPLYHTRMGDTFAFASELKALRTHPRFDQTIDEGALAMMMRLKHVPAPWTIYRHTRKLAPGTILTIRDGREHLETYWSVADAARAGAADPILDDDEALEMMDALLGDAVGLRMHADVPLGAFLSGGVDSAAIVALMQERTGAPVETFTIGFADGGYDETAAAARTAAALGTAHRSLQVRPDDAMALIPSLPAVYDEPFSDSSQLPTLLVSRLAREHVTVALSGDGGDEVFGGYNRYAFADRVARVVSRVPRSGRRLAARALTAPSPDAWDRAFARVASVVPRGARQRMPGDKLHKLASLLRGADDDLYTALLSHWNGRPPVPGAVEPTWMPAVPPLSSAAERMMCADAALYLPGDILTKLDRASMSVGLEARVPFLDHRVVELAWRLPLRMKITDGSTKHLLRRILARRLPLAMDAPKMGFGIPIGAWLRGPLRAWAEELLAKSADDGLLDARVVAGAWADHLSGRRNRQYEIWDVLMFQAWRETSRVPSGEVPDVLSA